MAAVNRGLIIDSFAGGGGASTGIEWALDRSPDFAINHSREALAMHAANHPLTVHLEENVWKVDPFSVTKGAPVFLLWASPDCRHHSKAKGGAPVSRSVRGLADVVILWAKVGRPQIIALENVEEFQDWGPLTEDGMPCQARKGTEFGRWVRALGAEGYAVGWWQLRACDYGAPTIRKRLFVVARRDGKPIIKPAPTHGDPKSEAVKAGQLKPWRTAAEIIDWSRPCPSIFLTKPEAKAAGLNIIRPLADKTLARIARGFKRYVLDRPAPFIVSTGNGGDLAAVYLAQHNGNGVIGRDPAEPLSTVTTSAANQQPVMAFIQSYYSSGGQDAPADESLRTVPTKARFSPITGECAAPPLAGWQIDRARMVAAFLRSHGFWDDREFVTVGEWIVWDIGMRMLSPREPARAQGFPDDYILAAPCDGKPLTETAQRHKIGNSVCPHVVEAVIRANCIDALAMPNVRRRRATVPDLQPIAFERPSFLEVAE